MTSFVGLGLTVWMKYLTKCHWFKEWLLLPCWVHTRYLCPLKIRWPQLAIFVCVKFVPDNTKIHRFALETLGLQKVGIQKFYFCFFTSDKGNCKNCKEINCARKEQTIVCVLIHARLTSIILTRKFSYQPYLMSFVQVLQLIFTIWKACLFMESGTWISWPVTTGLNY